MQYKISPLLYNCSLNTALPIMLSDLDDLAKLEVSGTLPSTETETAGAYSCYSNYCLLKETFCKVYNLDNTILTWQELNEFLKSCNSFFAVQAIFAPVIRKFIGEISRRLDTSYDLDSLTEIQKDTNECEPELDCTGRYTMLTVHEASLFFHEQFAITINECISDDYPITPIRPTTLTNIPEWATQQDTKRSITLYLKHSHFEITTGSEYDAALEMDRSELRELETHNSELYNLIYFLYATDSELNTNIQLTRLKLYVHNHLHPFSHDDPEAFNQHLLDYIAYEHKNNPQNIEFFLLTLAGIYTKQDEEPESSCILLELLIQQNIDDRYNEYINFLQKNLDFIMALRLEFVQKTPYQSESTVATIQQNIDDQYFYDEDFSDQYIVSNHKKKKSDICYSIFTSAYFKLFMLAVIITATLTLTAFILSTTNTSQIIPGLLKDLSPTICKVLIGVIAGVDSFTGVCLAGSIFQSNKSCMFNNYHHAKDKQSNGTTKKLISDGTYDIS